MAKQAKRTSNLAGLVERAADLDRERIRRDALERFNAERMTDGYEALMRRLTAREPAAGRLTVVGAASRAAAATTTRTA